MTDTIRAAATGGPVVPSRSLLRPLGAHELRVVGGFWGRIQELNASAIIAHCERWMERIGWIGNFDRAADGTVAEHHDGIEFVDSEVYKLLEAMAWELGRSADPALEGRYRSLVDRVAAAQEPDGYLHTAFGRPGQRPRYSDLEWGHELYCFGHLFQAAVARARSGHPDDMLVIVARRLADHVVREFGPEGRDAICGHPEIETALVELGRTLGEERYVEQARLFVERRGRRTLRTTLFQGSDYFLDDVPVREATVLRGHAVRAAYFASGALDVAVETGDDALLAAVADQWRATVAHRTYLTGGIGAHHQNEEFGADDELPPDRAYAETCAAIGSVMVGWRLLLQTGAAHHADLIERTLLNAVLVSPREDGEAFFYANTLHQRQLASETDDDELSERAEASLRAAWFEVSCCPTNVARTLAGVASYFATADDDGVQLHQYGDVDLDTVLPDGRAVSLRVRSGYPYDGRVVVTVERDAEFTLSLRIPAWSAGRARLTVAREEVQVDGDTASLHRAFASGDDIVLELDVAPRFTVAAPGIDAVRGTVAVERGPLVLCLESPDLPEDVRFEDVRLDPSRSPRPTERGARVDLLVEERPADDGWPYRRLDDAAPASRGRSVSAELVPYASWANRGPGLMRVWIPAAG
ncbi:glycoside hydrolase family 127 protein [Leifsonia poae]|uniref:glycoside hydrolase family 127 protein n=1 Tax=Leifsonia poae TaxID=110933 RepID=UPI003D69396B